MQEPVAKFVGWARHRIDGKWQPWEPYCFGRDEEECRRYFRKNGMDGSNEQDDDPHKAWWSTVILPQGEEPLKPKPRKRS